MAETHVKKIDTFPVPHSLCRGRLPSGNVCSSQSFVRPCVEYATASGNLKLTQYILAQGHSISFGQVLCCVWLVQYLLPGATSRTSWISTPADASTGLPGTTHDPPRHPRYTSGGTVPNTGLSVRYNRSRRAFACGRCHAESHYSHYHSHAWDDPRLGRILWKASDKML